jgi:hypothetical protein
MGRTAYCTGPALRTTMTMLGAACHYCGEPQPKRRLRRLELSSLGDVLVCRDVEPCQRRARTQLYARTSAAVASPTGPPVGRRRRTPVRTLPLEIHRAPRRPRAWWPISLGILILGVLVLPHVAIDGHHYRVWLFP